jgi:Kdo2-lipid IVA lauroyltransferase/acyltransferase
MPLWLRGLGLLPFWLLYALAPLLSVLLRYVLRYRVNIARGNLQRCFPEFAPARIGSIVNSYYWRLGQIVVEFLKLAGISADELRRRVPITNLQTVRAELAAGRSVILLAAHLGNWEWQLQSAVLQIGAPLDAAYKPLHTVGADRALLSLRSRFGARMVAAKKLLRVVARRRGQLHVIALMADQIPASSGGRHWLSFLGRATAFYPGPGEIARMTGYTTYFVSMRRTGRGHYQMAFQPLMAAGEQLEAEAFTARYATFLEAEIRADPANWIWTHRRWKLAPPPQLASQG